MVKSARYSEQVVIEVIRRVRAGELHTKVADELGVKQTTAFNWIQQDRAERGEARVLPPKYTAEFKADAVEFARTKGISVASNEVGVATTLLAKWARAAKVETLSSRYPKELVQEVVSRVRAGEELRKVAASVGVKPGTVADWMQKDREARAVPVRKQSAWSLEERAKALEISKSDGLLEASAMLGIPPGTIRHWRWCHEFCV